MNKPVVLITGALTGIGRATAMAFAAEGANIVISGRRDSAGVEFAEYLRQRGSEVEFVRADVSVESDVKQLVDSVVRFFGRLDVAVNNAGTEGSLGPTVEQTKENYDHIFNTNVLGVFLSMKHQLPVMLSQGGGSIINLSSAAGRVAFAGAGLYVASKHAVEGLTKSAALEVAGSGVRVNAVAPGPVETAMIDRFTGNSADAKAGMIAGIPARRLALPEEIAKAILYLAGPNSTYVTGQSIVVDGGYTAQ